MAYDVQIVSQMRLHTFARNPEFKQRLEEAAQQVLWEARKMASDDIARYMFDSAHDAHRAVLNSVYKKAIGGNINILSKRHAGRQMGVKPSSRGRTAKTTQMLSYYGSDRGFALRWANDTTAERWTKNMDGHRMYRKSVSERPKNRKYKYPSRLGGRNGAGKVNSRTVGMFDKVADGIMPTAANQFLELIDRIIIDMF